MCGIAGIMYKGSDSRFELGKDLIQMLAGCQHRGKDSSGFALYDAPAEGQLRFRFFAGVVAEAKQTINDVKNVLKDLNAEIVSEEAAGGTYRMIVTFDGPIQKFSYAVEHAATVSSIGTSLDIIKDIGTAEEVDERFDVQSRKGTHGVGHVRMATESDVTPEAAHPFWATGFADIAIVHNGQITNYWKMRRRLEQQGFEFRTENDSELIAVFLAEKLSKSIPLLRALEYSIEELDGSFSFLVSTKDEIGYAKDRLAVKPMVLYETADLVAIASEEVSLNRLFPGKMLDTNEPLPGTFNTWSKSI